MTSDLIQIQNGKANFDFLEEVAAPAASGGCGGGCNSSGSTPEADSAPANFIPLTAISHNAKESAALKMEDVRAELDGKNGAHYWRSLNELARKPEFDEMMAREFPGGAPASWTAVSRRNFLRLMGASLALAGLAGCARQPEERIVPYVKQPEDLIPGRPLFFASAHPWNGYARGVLVESQMGRPTKIEGNPDHPASLGKADAMTQAALLTMYDPDRSQAATKNGEKASWDSFVGEISALVQKYKSTRGAGLRILTETVTSPTQAAQMQQLLQRLPEARWHVWEPAGFDNARMGARQAFGGEASVHYRFDRADVIVSLDSNFLMDEPGSVRYARDFADNRRVRTREGKTKMNRLYSFESTPAITGANADHRWPAKASDIVGLAQRIAGDLGLPVSSGAVPASTGVSTSEDETIRAIANDLQTARGRSIVIVGANQPPEVHALALAINSQLGNIGKTVIVTDPVEATPSDSLSSLRNLVSDMNAGRVDTLIVIDSNPVYTAPADLKFLEAFKKVQTRVRLGLYEDETSNWCNWHIPRSHFLEEWGDARAHDGTASIIQPLIEPLYESASPYQLLSVLLELGDRNGYDIVREYWTARAAGLGGANFETWWRKVLNDGVVPGTQAKPILVGNANLDVGVGSTPTVAAGLEITFHPDPYIRDGRDANNGWLQELPRPMTKITWDNAALVSLETARKLNIENYEMVKITVGGRSLEMPVWIMPGQPDDSVAVQLGFGRSRAGKVAEGAGFDTYQLRASNAMWIAGGAQIAKTDGTLFTLAVTQEHHTLDTRNAPKPNLPNSSPSLQEPGANGDKMDSFHDRDIIRVLPIDKLKANPTADPHKMADADAAIKGEIAPEHGRGAAAGHGSVTGHDGKEESHGEEHAEHPNLMPPIWPSDRKDVDENGVPVYKSEQKGYGGNPIPQWAMSIDLTTCIGCNACTTACQAENNIAVVGKEEVVRGREMHWIRIDRYYKGDVSNPSSYHQPVACMHCEKAPCEPVCPVEATTHSAEGINEMTYNRCVGTKYCSNNCPYKVRRFNFLQYSEQDSVPLQMMKNPDVTVRSRGVMEKCTFCIQRINEARVAAEKENRPIRDGEFQTACQQTCPTNAIVFGNLTDRNSAVYKAKAEPHDYGLLTELNTMPRTTYLARVTNPNPAIKTT
jgi:molybdopterin-containing oxidoreductase family iron-sulfur binding subunit